MSKSRIKRINEEKRIVEPEASSTESMDTDSPIPGKIVNSDLVQVRSAPYRNTKNVIETIGNNDEFQILGRYGGFRKIKLSDGRVGFIASNFCEVVL